MNNLKSKDGWILELRSQQSKSLKEAILASNWMMGSNHPIFLLDDGDDDDDVVVSSSRPFGPARNAVSQQSGRDSLINEDDLELRLGLAGTTGTGKTSVDRGSHHKHIRLPASCTIDLCDEVGEKNRSYFKASSSWRFYHSAAACAQSDVPSNQSKEPKLTCAICMSAMEEETSTVCGHIFCKKCITNAIQAQKKCPTCRKRLTINNIHRIYLFSSTE